MKKINNISFFKTDTITLAKNLIGKYIVTNINGKIVKEQITETEAYLGINDSACHSYNGKKTNKTEPMWKEGGTIYVYLCYGMHYMLNIVSGKINQPEAVLIRATKNANGPGKLTKLLNINKSLNGKSIINNSEVYLLDDNITYNFTTAPRVGINYAKEKDRNAPLRFIIK